MENQTDRETKEIITPVDGIKVVLVAWITGRERRILRRIYLDQMKWDKDTDESKLNTGVSSADLIELAENTAIEKIVVSVNGKEENKVDAILDMKEKDYDFVITEIKKISVSEDFTKPKQSQ